MKRVLLCSMILAVHAGVSYAQAGPLFVASAFSDWKTGPDGVARMNLVGDSTSPTGLSAFRLRYPAGVGSDSSKAVVHFHMGTEQILVLKGTYVVGFGDSVDYAAARAYTAEGFVVIPSGRPHYHWTRGETEIHVEALGPSTTRPWPRIQRPIGAPPLQPPPVDSTYVWPNGLPEWTIGGGGGARMNLAGNRPPSTTELIAYRSHRPARVNADTTIRVIYHYHFGTEHITILKGTFYFGIGDKVDRSQARAYGPGSFIENPSGTKHFEWFTAGETVYQVNGIGNLGAIPLDPETGQPPVARP